MQISTRFSIAVHIICCIEVFKDKHKITSDFLSKSVNVNPVIIRNILKMLQKSNIIETKKGVGGSKIARPLEQITLLDVYVAVQSVSNEGLFKIHKNSNLECPVGKNIYDLLNPELINIENFLKEKMKLTKLSFIVDQINSKK